MRMQSASSSVLCSSPNALPTQGSLADRIDGQSLIDGLIKESAFASVVFALSHDDRQTRAYTSSTRDMLGKH